MKSTLLALVALTLLSATVSAQLLYPTVSVDVQRLPEEAQTKLLGLDSVLTQYLSDTRQAWNRDDGAYDLPVQINIFFTEYTPNPQEDKYKAQLIISNEREARFEDKRWEFGLRTPYRPQPGNFDSFAGVLEFYVWILTGNEEDKYEKLGGNRYYDRARQVQLSSTGSIYYTGWDKRSDLLREITGESNRTYRELVFFHFTGLYFDEEKDYENSRTYLHYALLKLEAMSIDQREKFMESEHRALAQALKDCQYDRGMRVLLQLDPAHAETYNEVFGELPKQ